MFCTNVKAVVWHLEGLLGKNLVLQTQVPKQKYQSLSKKYFAIYEKKKRTQDTGLASAPLKSKQKFVCAKQIHIS